MHTVVFWLKDGTPESTAGEMATFYREKITKVRGVDSVNVGVTAGTERDVVDNSYQLMSSVVFADADAATAWQSDPVHDAFRDRFGARFERVVVYDTVV